VEQAWTELTDRQEEDYARQTHPTAHGARQTRFARGKGTLMLAAVLVHRFYMRRSLKDFDTKVGND
jgi:hypothetical protein